MQVVLAPIASSSSHADPEKNEPQLFGSAPGSPAAIPSRGGRHQYQSRFGLSRTRPRLDEPRVLVGGVVDDQVHHQLHAAVVHAREQRVEVGERAEHRVDALVVADVVAVVVLRRGIDRREPEHVDAERREVVEPPGDAREIADAVAVGVGEAARIDLVDDRGLPPLGDLRRGASHSSVSGGAKTTTVSKSSLMSTNRCSARSGTNAIEPGRIGRHDTFDVERRSAARDDVHLVLGVRCLAIDRAGRQTGRRRALSRCDRTHSA